MRVDLRRMWQRIPMRRMSIRHRVVSMSLGRSVSLGVMLWAGCYHNSPPRVGQPYDVAVIPGCPSEADGRLSRCQKERAAWAAILWQRGQAAHVLTSGSAVYTPYVEAEHLAAAVAALGVPADRIYLDPHALHTDENMRNAVRIARELGWQHATVASHGPQAKGGCGMITGWGLACTGLPIDRGAIHDTLERAVARLASVRVRPSPSFCSLAEREAAREHETGHSRPRSAWLYFKMWLRRQFGAGTPAPWLPATLPQPAFVRWSDVAYSDSAR